MSSQLEASEAVEVDWAIRWQVYYRLQELAIPCQCASHQPLKVNISNVAAAVQLWSVMRQFTLPRQDSICWLKHCWHHQA